MSKSQAMDFLGLYQSIFLDLLAYRPTFRRGLEKDYVRLKTLYAKRGSNLFLLDLPRVAKIFDRSLAAGSLLTAGEPLTRPINGRTKIPRLFSGIWKELFAQDGCLKQDIDPNLVLFLRTLLGTAKKFEVECAPEYLFEATKEFYDVEATLPPPSPLWDSDGRDCFTANLGSLVDRVGSSSLDEGLFAGRQSASDGPLLALVQRVADRVSSSLGEYLPQDWKFKHGPGATAEFARGKGYKYSFPSWSPRLESIFPSDLFAFANSSVLGREHDSGALLKQFEHHSRLIAVPKTASGPRLIAAEPTCHQWCQQNVADFLNGRVRETFLGASIDFRRQELSGDLALTSSRTKKLATIDLKSASDRLSCWLLQRLFRANRSVLSAMVASRTRYISNAIDKKMPKLHKLRKFASMGSALTFPTQSIVFFMLCLAAGASLQPKESLNTASLKRLGSQVRVYGDDLIVPVEWVPRVRYILERLYLRINVEKSFSSGSFRESCGVDAYDGYEVTPPRVRVQYTESATGTLSSVVDVSNHFFTKGFWHAAQWLQRSVPRGVRKHLPVVHVSSGSFGLSSFVGFVATSRKRWNRDYQRVENLSWVTSSRVSADRYEGFANLLQYFTEDPDPALLWESGKFARPVSVLARRWVALGAEAI